MMFFLTKIFYLLSFLFIYVEVFQLVNRKAIYGKLDFDTFETKDPIYYLVFYVARLIYIPWMYIGLFSFCNYFFIGLLALGLGKFLILRTKNNFSINLYDLINMVLSCILLVIIFLQGFFR